MTKMRDIIRSQIQHKETHPVPYTLDFEEDVDKELDAYYGNTDWRNTLKSYIYETEVVETMRKLPTEQDIYERDPYGSIWRMDRRPFHLEKPALEIPSLKGYKWPSPEEFYKNEADIGKIRATCTEKSREQFINGWLGWGLFETSWGIRGYENVLMDIVENTSFYESLLDRITEQFLTFIDFTCTQLPDIDAIMFGDDWGEQRGVIMGPERWRKLFKPRYALIYEEVHKRGKYVFSHSCGSIVDILPDLIEIGLDVFESVQPEARDMNPYSLKKQFGDDITFWGCLGSQSTVQFGTPAEIHTEVKKLRAGMGSGGGFILAPAKGIQPGTPMENAAAVVEAFADDA